MVDWTEQLKRLQDDMATVDFMTERRPRPANPDFIELLIKKHKAIKIKMYNEPGHGRAHIHVDYGRQNHAASYAIDDGTRLAGTLDRKYDRQVREWIAQNRSGLLEAWSQMQADALGEVILSQLEAGINW